MSVLRGDAARRVLDQVRLCRRYAAARAADTPRVPDSREPHVQPRRALDREMAVHPAGAKPLPRMRRDHG